MPGKRLNYRKKPIQVKVGFAELGDQKTIDCNPETPIRIETNGGEILEIVAMEGGGFSMRSVNGPFMLHPNASNDITIHTVRR